MKNKLDALVAFLEKHLNSTAKLTVAGVALGLSVLGLLSLTLHNDVVASSVMITNLAGNNGGSGVVIKSSNTESSILTNGHVCGVAINGGKVIGQNGLSLMIREYTKSELHDLCLIKVSGNMGVSTDIADSGPNFYYEKALISGHPSLYPNVVTSGHFSGKSTIQVAIGFRKCTPDDEAGDLGFLCKVIGGLPIIKNYEATLVTATIMPGSSGSGVYNEKGELSGLVFAGSQGLSYAWTVPYEAMRLFLDKEIKGLVPTIPPSEVSLGGNKEDHSNKIWSALKENCDNNNPRVKEWCHYLDSDIIWRGKDVK